MTEFRVESDCYHGPLDLLLHLVRRNEIDVLEIMLGEIVARFLAVIQSSPSMDLDAAGEFLVVTTTLMEIKSRALLPRNLPIEPTDDEPQPSDLVRQLLEYRRFREAGALLWDRALRQHRKYRRLTDDLKESEDESPVHALRDLELWDLVSAFNRLLRENMAPVMQSIAADPTPIHEYMGRLEAAVLAADRIAFGSLLGKQNSRTQLVGKFLALLELIRSRRVWVEHDEETNDLVFCPPRPSGEQASMPMADPSPPPDANLAVPSTEEPASAADGLSSWSDYVPIQHSESMARQSRLHASEDDPNVTPGPTTVTGDNIQRNHVESESSHDL